MKKIKLLFLLILIAQLFFSCKKDGQLIEAKGYGKLAINSTTSADIGPLLVDIDGKVTDTLKGPSDNASITTYTGNRKVRIYEQGKANTPVIDTVLNIKTGTEKLSFLYTGDVKIIGGGYDGSITPAKGSALAQFVNLDKSLPTLVDMKIYEVYSNDAGDFIPEEVAYIKGIGKNKFSPYIEIPPYKHGDFSFGYYYALFDSATGATVVDISTYPAINWSTEGGGQFRPDKVVSLGITYDASLGGYTTAIIYETQLKQ
ncbi:hypothetical protein LX99_00063 [Mucilaginibacter oryzae]|uniref:DUF4397 domain-containing protein n=1 Tax=Mucilaginibacter oryzae TaxID=468058 RepID=A0A316HGI6_9SPHI|nr:hypothetical protein [Mucilaginibacter oryzae]PWK79606.1 hypothetical protein LX99_00063 [Mucilaginibacter oryzae]